MIASDTHALRTSHRLRTSLRFIAGDANAPFFVGLFACLSLSLCSIAAAKDTRLTIATVEPKQDDAIIRFRTTPTGHVQLRVTKRLVYLEEKRHGRTYPLAARKGYRRSKRGPTEIRILALEQSVLVQVVDPIRRRTVTTRCTIARG